MMPPVYLLRHGQTDWNGQARLQGQADTRINACGRVQARRNGRALAALLQQPSRFDFVASPLQRTRETMELARGAMGLDPAAYRTDDRLMEIHFGDWQGFTYDELEACWPGCTAARSRDKWHFLPPGPLAESYAMLAERVRSWLAELTRPTVGVTHGGVIRVLHRLVLQLPHEEVVVMDVPQDRVLAMRPDRMEWI